MNEVFYFLQWYWAKKVAKFKEIEYKPALWHFTLLIILAVLCFPISVLSIEASSWAILLSFMFTSFWYFVKMWFFWDWQDYQREKSKTFDILKSDYKED